MRLRVPFCCVAPRSNVLDSLLLARGAAILPSISRKIAGSPVPGAASLLERAASECYNHRRESLRCPIGPWLAARSM